MTFSCFYYAWCGNELQCFMQLLWLCIYRKELTCWWVECQLWDYKRWVTTNCTLHALCQTRYCSQTWSCFQKHCCWKTLHVLGFRHIISLINIIALRFILLDTFFHPETVIISDSVSQKNKSSQNVFFPDIFFLSETLILTCRHNLLETILLSKKVLLSDKN